MVNASPNTTVNKATALLAVVPLRPKRYSSMKL